MNVSDRMLTSRRLASRSEPIRGHDCRSLLAGDYDRSSAQQSPASRLLQSEKTGSCIVAMGSRAALRAAAALLCTLVLVACATTGAGEKFTPTLARVFLESADGAGMEMVLPQSGVHLIVNVQPVLTEGDIANVEVAQVDLGKCLMFQLTPSAARDFYRLSGSHQGRRLLLVVNGTPIGGRRVDGPITDGVVFVFAELPDSALPKLVEDLKKTTVALQREIARKP